MALQVHLGSASLQPARLYELVRLQKDKNMTQLEILKYE
jgi:hypothetical protein